MAELIHIRAVLNAAQLEEPPSPHLLEKILERRQRGDRFILPAAMATTARPRRLPRVTAAAVAILAVAALVLFNARQLQALRSGLVIRPERPVAGQVLRLEYVATSRLADEPRLVVRARIRTPETGRSVPRTVAIGFLEGEGSGRFSGTVRLPDSVVYAVLAVEDTRAEFVDHHGGTWEVLIHREDGRPRFAALRQRELDATRRDSRLGAEIGAGMREHYPERAEGWRGLLWTETERAPRAAADSIRAHYRASVLPAVTDAIDSGDFEAESLWSAVMLAREIGAMDEYRRWKALLYERFPTSEWALQHRTFDLHDAHAGDRAGLMEAFETLYDEVGPASQLGYSALQLARTIGDPALVKRWAGRLLEADPTFRLSVASWLVQMPSLRTDALPLLDREIERAGEENRPVDPAEVEAGAFPASPRDVTESRLLYDERQRQALGRLLGLQGEAYLAIGDTLGALRALESAWGSSWEPEQFRTLGSLRLARGDSAGAAAAFARVAVDPVTRGEAESLVAKAGTDPAIWAAAVERARADLLQYVRQQELDRQPLLARLRLHRVGGGEEDVLLARGTPMLVAFWSRFCAPSNAQMPALASVAAKLEAAGIPVLTVADEDPAPLAAYTGEQGLTYPVYSDPDHDARRAFDSPGFPTFYVLDGEGRIRFETHSAAESLRFLDSLRPIG